MTTYDPKLPTVPENATRGEIIAAELTQDPLTWGYAGMTNPAAADRMNNVATDPGDPLARIYDRTEFTTAELYEALDSAELHAKHVEALSEWVAFQADPTGVQLDRYPKMAELKQILDLTGPIKVDAKNTQDRILAAMNNPGSAVTRQNLADMRSICISRGTELGVGVVTVGDIEAVRGIGYGE